MNFGHLILKFGHVLARLGDADQFPDVLNEQLKPVLT